MCIGSYADISVHAPTRGATSNSLSFSIFSVFQSTLPREERLLGLNFKEANSIFQSTLPREERRFVIGVAITHYAFQSTLPREERRYRYADFEQITDFNPRSHERSDPCKRYLYQTDYVISIHAPTRGATLIIIILNLINKHFNPRSHERSDQCLFQFLCFLVDFNPRSHERSDGIKSMRNFLITKFQSTLPREERHCGVIDNWRLNKISIHAPTRGATISGCRLARIV